MSNESIGLWNNALDRGVSRFIYMTICAWHIWGAEQPGKIENNLLIMSDMMRMTEGPLNQRALAFLLTWAKRMKKTQGDPSKVENILPCLRNFGFSGSCGYEDIISLELGYFCPVLPLVQQIVRPIVFVSSAIRWVFGAPGLLATESEYSGCHEFRCVGVFVGDVSRFVAIDKQVLHLE